MCLIFLSRRFHIIVDSLSSSIYSTDHVLNEFVRDCVVRYLETDIVEVRKAAALTCCQLFARDKILEQTSQHAIQVVNEVLERLLTVGVADPGKLAF